ncbi:MAG: peptidylprolyl isomerase [Alphaproteobacteria bacterium]|nr:peptidylprolyl isomerase [Alphaproteobacteria bacterium]
MLEYLRKAHDKPLAKVLMGILVFSFVGWGVASYIFGESRIDDSLVRVGGAPVKIQNFENEKSRLLTHMAKEEQKRIYSDKAARNYFFEQILSRMTSQLMMEMRAHDLGLTVSKAEVAKIIKHEPAFQMNGKFDIGQYKATLSYVGMTEDQLENSIRAGALREMTLAGVTTGMPAPNFMTTAMFNARYTSRQIDYVAVKFADFKASANPTDAQLKETYAKNPKTIPEFRKISYVLIPTKMETPDSFEVGYKAAQKLEDALIGGEPMSTAAAKVNAKFVILPEMNALMKAKDGKAISDTVFNAQMLSEAFHMDEGIESQILETKSGFVIMRVDNIIPSHPADFESMKKEVTEQWRKSEQQKQAYARANELLIKLNDKGTLEGAKSATVGRANGAPVEVLSAAFANSVGAKTIVPGADAFYVLSVKKSIAPSVDAAKHTAVSKEANAMLNRMIADDYMAFLTREYPVKVNQKMYKRVFGE